MSPFSILKLSFWHKNSHNVVELAQGHVLEETLVLAVSILFPSQMFIIESQTTFL